MLINEAKRMQYLAGILNESQLNEEEDIMEEGLKDWILAGLITLGTIAGGTKVYQMDKEYEADKKAQAEYYDNILSKAFDKMTDEQKADLGMTISSKTKALMHGSKDFPTQDEWNIIHKSYANDYVKAHPNEFSISAKDGLVHWKYEQAASYGQQ